MEYDSETLRRFADRLREENASRDDGFGWSGGIVVLLLVALIFSVIFRVAFVDDGQALSAGGVVMASIAPVPSLPVDLGS